MHEAAITQSIITTVLNTVAQEKVTGMVKSVNVTVGVCQGLVPESMQMFFDMEKPGTPLENAELVVNTQSMVSRCSVCDTEHALDIPVLYCPNCGKQMELIKGSEIIISSIEVEDEQN